MDRYENTMQNRSLSGLRLLLIAAVVVVIMLGTAGVAHADDPFTISSPDNNAKVELGKSVAIKGHASYTSPPGSNVLINKKPNYIYVRVTKEGEQESCFDNFDSPYSYTSSSIFFGYFDISFTPSEEGQYLIEVCRDLTYEDGEHVAMTNDRFEAQKSRTIIVQRKLNGDSGAQLTIPDQTYTGEALTPAPTVTLDAGTEQAKVLDPETDYDVTYKNNVETGTATVTVTGKGFYKNSVSGTFRIEPADISTANVDESALQGWTYNGDERKPEPAVTRNGRELVKDTDYELSYEDNISAGSNAKVIVTGKGNFQGSQTKTFNIGRASILNRTLSGIENMKYTGKPLTLSKLALSGCTVGIDYTVTYKDNTGPGTATVTLEGIGNYKSKIVRTFNIEPSSPQYYPPIYLPQNNTQYPKGSEIDVYSGTQVYVYNVTNYIYVRVKRDGVTILYDKKAVPESGFSQFKVASFTANEKGKYQIQVTASTNKALTESAFSPANENVIYVDTPVESGKVGIATATITGVADKVYTGDSITQSGVSVRLLDGTLLQEGRDYYLTYARNLNAGTAYVYANGMNNYQGYAGKRFTIAKKPLTPDMIILDQDEFPYTGALQKPGAYAKDGDKTLAGVRDLSSIQNPGGTEPGTYYVTINAASDGNYSGSARKAYSIGKTSIKDATVTLDQTDFVYDGQPKKPNVTSVKFGDIDLTEDEYDVSYSGNTNAGTAKVIVTAKDNSALYTGKAVVPFTITKHSIAADDVTLAGMAPVEFTGKPLTPAVHLSLSGETLTAGVDYELEFQDNTAAGTGKVTITGKGNFDSSRSGSFQITRRSIDDESITVDPIDTQSHDTGACEPAVTVKDGKTVLEQGKDYVLDYIDNDKPGLATVTITGIGNYQEARTEHFTVTPGIADARAELSQYITELEGSITQYLEADQQILREAITEAKRVRDDDSATLEQLTGTLENLHTSQATAEENLARHVEEGKTDIAGAEITLATDSYTYDGTAKEPVVSKVMLDGTKVPETDYLVSYKDNTGVGTATVTVVARTTSATYTGSATTTFAIDARSISGATVKLKKTSYTYDGTEKKPGLKSIILEGTALDTKDYDVTYSANTNAGTEATVTVTGKGNYKDTATAKFTINRLSLAEAEVTLAETSYVSDGQEKKPAVMSVKVGNLTVPAEDYEVSYRNNIEPGRAVVTVAAKKDTNYSDSTSASFQIIGKEDLARQDLADKVNELEGSLNKYLAADKEKLRGMIDEAKALVDDDAATLGELEKALSDLEQAQTTAERNLVKAEEQAKAEEEARRQEADPRSAASVEKKLISQKSDSDPAGSSYAPLRLRSTKQSASSNTLAWQRTSGAAEYMVYGNKCGSGNKLQKLATVKGTSFTHSKLVKGTYYKYVVVAVKNTGKSRQVAAVSKMIHVGTAGGKAGNFKSVKISGKVLKKAKKLKSGKTLKLNAKAVKSGKKAKKHCGVRYESSNTRIATVNGSGVVKGVRKGTCTVYAYTQNGVCKTIKVKVI